VSALPAGIGLPPELLAQRREVIGGSEIATIIGLPHFKEASPIDIYLSKVEGYEREATFHMERGTFFEDGAARWFAHRTGFEVRPAEHVRHPTFKHVGCTPDRYFNTPDGETRLLSIKVPGNWLSEEWGEPYAWRVPTAYYLQLQYEMGICGALGLCRVDSAKLAAPLNGDLVILDVPCDTAVIDRLFQEAESWWARHVDARVPPPLDGSKSATEWLRRRFPTSDSPVRAATPAEDILALELQSAEEALAVADKAYERARQPVEEAIGAAEGLDGPFGRITFRANKKGVRSLRTTWTTPLHQTQEKAS
jgi:putative phage-type endonuclease